jgi:hypothetical protein
MRTCYVIICQGVPLHQRAELLLYITHFAFPPDSHKDEFNIFNQVAFAPICLLVSLCREVRNTRFSTKYYKSTSFCSPLFMWEPFSKFSNISYVPSSTYRRTYQEDNTLLFHGIKLSTEIMFNDPASPSLYVKYSLRPKKNDVLGFKICPKKNDVLLNLACVHVHVGMQQSINT